MGCLLAGVATGLSLAKRYGRHSRAHIGRNHKNPWFLPPVGSSVSAVAKGRFSGSRQRHVARLLDLVGALGLMEILRFVGGDRRSLERSLESLEGQGLLTTVETEGGAAPGRVARLWSLTDAGREAVPWPAPADVGRLAAGSTWVVATARGPSTAALEARLSDGRLLATADWIARLDGAGHSYFACFPPGTNSLGPQVFLRVLDDVADCTSGTVRTADSPRDFIDVLRRAQQVVEEFEE